jgi:hypothetical protein
MACAPGGTVGGTAGGSTDDDGTPDQGPGDAPGTPAKTVGGVVVASGDDDGTPDQGPGDAPGTAGAPGTATACEFEVSSGPHLLDVDSGELSTGGVTQVFAITDLPEGTYDELKFKIHKLAGHQSLGDADFDGKEASVVVSGKRADGSGFTFTAKLSDQQKLHGPFVVGGDAPSNITLSIDPKRWFVDGSGAFLEPGDEANRDEIERNMKSSIDAFDDDDHDGFDDHGGRGMDDGPGHVRGGGMDDGPNHT